jgi:hypothetical protein
MEQEDRANDKKYHKDETFYITNMEMDQEKLENTLETNLERKHEEKGHIRIENVKTADCIKIEDTETGEDITHVKKDNGMVDICLVENEYWEIPAHGERGKNNDNLVTLVEDGKLEYVIEEVDDSESVLDNNYNSLTILSPSFKKTSIGCEIRRIFSSKTDLKSFVFKHKNYVLWCLVILAGFLITLRMVIILCF